MEAAMKTIPYPAPAREIVLDYHGPRWTCAYEVQLLCWLAQQTKGGILEIGCNEGRTTRELALANPHRFVMGVDYTGCDDTLCPEQKREKPHATAVGRHANMLANVQVFDTKSAELPRVLPNIRDNQPPIGFIFIDGDHSYRGVKADTLLALDIIAGNIAEGAGGGIIAWHDCYDHAPGWVGVKSYLDKEIAPKFGGERVEGTWLAILDLRA
jgi:hypothetical protein